MRNTRTIWHALIIAALLIQAFIAQATTTQYWDTDGTNPGLGVGGPFDWWAASVWNTDPAGASAGVVGGWANGNNAVFNGNGTSTVTVSMNSTNNVFSVGSGVASGTAVTLNLGGSATVYQSAGAYIGQSGTASSATLNLGGGGSLTYSGTGQTYIGGPGCSGTVNVTNGGYFGSYTLNIGSGGAGTVNVAGGNAYSFGNVIIGKTTTGTLNVTGSGLATFNNISMCSVSNANANININGGRLIIGSLTKTVVDPLTPAILNLNGGVIAPNKNTGTWIQNLDSVNVQSGGAIIDTTNFNATMISPLVTGVVGSPDGGLIKYGAGQLTISGTNTYTGSTLITTGTLALTSGTLLPSTPQISIASGATFYLYNLAVGLTLSGSGPQQTLACVSTNGTATISDQASPKQLTLASGALLSFQAAGGIGNTNGMINITSGCTLNNNAVTVNVVGAPLEPGTYRLMFIAGFLSGSAGTTATITGTPLESGGTARISTTAGYSGHVDLIITGKSTPVFSSLTASQTISYGTPGMTLSGKVSAIGPIYPASGETITVSINGNAQTTTISDSAGDFSINYNPSTIPYSAGPYSIMYSYAGDASLNSASDASTSVTVRTANPAITWPTPASIAYGTALGGSQLDASSTVSGTFAYSPVSGTILNAGSTLLTAIFTPTDGADYNTATNTVNLIVSPAALMVTAESSSQAYGSTNSVFAANVSGFVNGDTSSVLTGSPALSTAVVTNSPVGSYPIVVTDGTLSAANYDFTLINGNLTVTQAVLTVTADNLSRAYGMTNPVLTASISGLVNGESASDTNVLTGAADLSTTADLSSPVGSYTISATNGTLSATNYSFVFSNGVLTVASAQVAAVVTVNDKTYDGTTNATIESLALSGVVNGDDVSLVGGVASFGDPNVGVSKVVTVTGLTLTGTQATNYALASSVVTTNASINPATLTITAAANTKTYDGTTNAAAIPVSGGLFGSDSVSGLSESYGDKNVGAGKTLDVNGGYTVNDGNAGNNYSVSLVNTATGEIDPLAITITAGGNEKVYDGTVSATNVPVVSPALVAGDTAAFTVTYDTANVGSGKTLTPAGLVNDGNSGLNYSYAYQPSTAGVLDPATLAITANNVNKTYGQTVMFAGTEFTSLGLVASDSVTGVTLTSAGAPANAPVSGSPYSIVPSAAVGTGLSNYDINYVNGTLTVTASAGPTATSIIVSNGVATITFAGIANVTYVTQSATSLSGPWTAISTNTPSVGGVWTVTDTNAATQTFYRAMIP